MNSGLRIGLGAVCLLASLAPPAAAADTRITREMVWNMLKPATDQGAEADRLKYEDVVLPGDRAAWLFMVWRRPTLFLNNTDGKSRLTLSVYWNGVDQGKWPYWRILALVLKRVCSHGGGIGNAQAARALMRKRGRNLTKPKPLGGNAGMQVDTLYTAHLGRCRAEKRVVGSRWHTLSVTLELAPR